MKKNITNSCTHILAVLWVWHISRQPLYLTCTVSYRHTVKLAAVSNTMPTLKVSPWREFLGGFGSLASGYCPLMLLQSECKNCVACQKFVLKYFRERLKIRQTGKMKTCKNIALYGKAHLVEGIVSFPESILGVWECDSSIQFSPSLPVADLPQLQVPLKTQR